MIRNTYRLAAVLLSLTASIASAKDTAPEVPKEKANQTTRTPINIGLVPYLDINSHRERPRNNVSVDGIVGLTTAVDGVAVSGVVGVVQEDVKGVQVAGVVAIAGGDVTGAQVSGVVNVADDVDGLQLGVVNIGDKVRGTQAGLVNISDEIDGVQLGLINIVLKDGTHTLDISSSDTAALNIGTRLGSKHFYTILTAGVQPREDRTYVMTGIGLGGRIPVYNRVSLNIDAIAYQAMEVDNWDNDDLYFGKLQLTANYQVNERYGVFTGISLNALNDTATRQGIDKIGNTHAIETKHDDIDRINFGPGFVAGVHIF